MIIHLALNQKIFHNMLQAHNIQFYLIKNGRNVTNKEDKKCIILKMAKLSHAK